MSPCWRGRPAARAADRVDPGAFPVCTQAAILGGCMRPPSLGGPSARVPCLIATHYGRYGHGVPGSKAVSGSEGDDLSRQAARRNSTTGRSRRFSKRQTTNRSRTRRWPLTRAGGLLPSLRAGLARSRIELTNRSPCFRRVRAPKRVDEVAARTAPAGPSSPAGILFASRRVGQEPIQGVDEADSVGGNR